MTLNGIMGVFCVISATSVAFSAHYVKVVEDIPKLFATETLRKYSNILLMAIYSQWITPRDGVKVRNSPVVR